MRFEFKKHLLHTMPQVGDFMQYHAIPGFSFNNFTLDLYFEALNVEHFQICLGTSQSLGEGRL